MTLDARRIKKKEYPISNKEYPREKVRKGKGQRPEIT
jgi:hypothetical protein